MFIVLKTACTVSLKSANKFSHKRYVSIFSALDRETARMVGAGL